MFNVNPKTVTRWADSGQLTSIRTLGVTADTASPRSGRFSPRRDPRRPAWAVAADPPHLR